MATPLSTDSEIVVIGAGTWGLSIALHLGRRGYKNVTVLDAYPVPSPISAGNDLNKIIELGEFAGDDAEDRYVADTLIRTATNGWLEDPVFKPYFHECGCIVASCTEEGKQHITDRDGPSEKNGWVPLTKKEDFQTFYPEGVMTGDFLGWEGWYKKDGAGWVHARKSMLSAAREAKRQGIKFICGEQIGEVKELIYEDSDIKGAITADGTRHYADRTILANGANADAVFDMKDQLRPTAWTLAHIKMSPEEAQLYKNLPPLYNIESGFFMEPDEDNHELKICDEHPGYCNWTTVDTVDSKKQNIPFAKQQIPIESEKRIRQFLRDTMSQLADRPFSFARICWCADTPDRSFLISKHPEYPSLVLGVGASGHGFTHLPVIGGYILDCMEGNLDPRMEYSWRWRPETAVGRNWADKQGRFGPEGANRMLDFQDVREWTDILPSGDRVGV